MAKLTTAFLQRSLTLRHLRLLIVLDELRQISRAADTLHVSQPAVSKALAEIESGVGMPLFERTPRGLIPTPHGACLLRYAQIVVNELARAGDELSGLERGIAAAVSVGAMPGCAGDALAAAILLSRQRLPDLLVTVSEAPMEQLLRQLRAGKIDLVVGALAERALPADLEQRPLYNEPLVVVCGEQHPMARTRRPAWPALVAQPWILPARAARLRELVEAMWRRMGLAPPPVLAEAVSLDLIIDLLGRTSALALLPHRQAKRSTANGGVVVLDVEVTGVVLPMCTLRVRDAPVSMATSTLEECLVDIAARG